MNTRQQIKNNVLPILLLVVISCGKNTTSTTETLLGTEYISSEEAKDNSNFSEQHVEEVIDNVFHAAIEMEIDETVFVVDNGTNNANEEMTAGIMKMLSPQPYAMFKKQAEAKPTTVNGITTIDIKEVLLQGKQVLLEKSMTTDAIGDTMMMRMYAIPAGDQTIMISAYYMKKEEAKYLPLIEKSVLSAKLKN